jgi:nucleoid-associated protein YgaU
MPWTKRFSSAAASATASIASLATTLGATAGEFSSTATFHQEKIQKYADGQIFDVITNGVGLMPGYRWPIPPADRWAIIGYVRQLQRDRQARNATAPAPASPPAPASNR